MDLGQAFGFVTKDRDWFGKILLGGVIVLIPIVGFLAVYGFSIQTAQNVKRGDPQPLPAWGDFGTHLVKGLYFIIINIVYAIPFATILMPLACGAGFFFAENESSLVGILLMAVLYGLALPVTYGSQLFVEAALFRYVQTDQLGAALNIVAVLRAIRTDSGTYLLLFAIRLLASIVTVVGISIFGIGVLFTAVYAQAMFGHALGQLAALPQMTEQATAYNQPAASAQEPLSEYPAEA